MQTRLPGTWVLITSLALFLSGLSAAQAGNNLHLIDQNPETGFAIYRTGEPKKDEMRELCELGVEEMVVLSGNADDHEWKYQNYCPTLRVVYNERQRTSIPLTQSFLEFFDNWVATAQAEGKKIAFRCNCGCHRTGRLAAYYQMKYQRLTEGDALSLMNEKGKFMVFYPHLEPQVRALSDYIQGRNCTEKNKYCVGLGV